MTCSYPASQLNNQLAQHAHQIVATVPAFATVTQVLLRDGRQAKRIIRLAMGQQSGIRGDARTVKLQ